MNNKPKIRLSSFSFIFLPALFIPFLGFHDGTPSEVAWSLFVLNLVFAVLFVFPLLRSKLAHSLAFIFGCVESLFWVWIAYTYINHIPFIFLYLATVLPLVFFSYRWSYLFVILGGVLLSWILPYFFMPSATISLTELVSILFFSLSAGLFFGSINHGPYFNRDKLAAIPPEHYHFLLNHILDNAPVLLNLYNDEFELVFGNFIPLELSSIGGRISASQNMESLSKRVLMEEVLRSGKAVRFESDRALLDGKAGWSSVEYRLIKGPGNCPFVLLTASDVTERKQLEMSLREQRYWLDLLVSESENAICFIMFPEPVTWYGIHKTRQNKILKQILAHGVIRRYNESFENFFPAPSNAIETIHPDYFEQKNIMPVSDILKNCLENGFYFREYKFEKNGKEFWVRGDFHNIFDAAGHITGLIAEQRDITKEKEEEIRKSQIIRELEDAMTEIKQLNGLIPICSHCKKIRTDDGYWQQVEEYIASHSEAEFTHSLCPDCAHELYPNLYPEIPKPHIKDSGKS